MPSDESKGFEAELMGADAKHGTASPRKSRRRWPLLLISLIAVSVALVAAANYLLVMRPVATALGRDARNESFSIRAHFGSYVDAQTLVLDLVDVGSVAPVDLFRGLFQSASALHEAGRTFDRVVLARDGQPVFLLTGAHFADIGSEFSTGQNPVYLIRTLPERLSTPEGRPAFGSWSGGLLGVLNKQMEDANTAAETWASER